MKIAVASGKGGTGKTLIATNLAQVAASDRTVRLYDLDVEEPNDHLFFDGEQIEKEEVRTMIPVVNESQCTHCGICSDICEFNAIISLADNVLVFPELCHSCYACLELCPEGAISEGFKTIGEISVLETPRFPLVSGRLKVSESATAALISRTREKMPAEDGTDIFEIYDAPPGSSCPLIEAVKETDCVLLVGEPSPFGLHDMDLVVQTLEKMHIPFGVVINKAVEGNTLIHDYCMEKKIPVWAEIPQDMSIARAYARGELITERLPGIRMIFSELLERLMSQSERVCS